VKDTFDGVNNIKPKTSDKELEDKTDRIYEPGLERPV
jgi:hypothetical protein